MKYYTDFWKRYIDFTGKSTRAQYWVYRLVDLVIMLIFATPIFYVMSEPGTDLGAIDKMSMAHILTLLGASLLIFVYLIVTTVPQIALTIRRLRDAGLPTWLIFLWPLSYVFLELMDVHVAFWYAGLAVLIIGFILLMMPSKHVLYEK